MENSYMIFNMYNSLHSYIAMIFIEKYKVGYIASYLVLE